MHQITTASLLLLLLPLVTSVLRANYELTEIISQIDSCHDSPRSRITANWLLHNCKNDQRQALVGNSDSANCCCAWRVLDCYVELARIVCPQEQLDIIIDKLGQYKLSVNQYNEFYQNEWQVDKQIACEEDNLTCRNVQWGSSVCKLMTRQSVDQIKPDVDGFWTFFAYFMLAACGLVATVAGVVYAYNHWQRKRHGYWNHRVALCAGRQPISRETVGKTDQKQDIVKVDVEAKENPLPADRVKALPGDKAS